jgi:hypothetical protein
MVFFKTPNLIEMKKKRQKFDSNGLAVCVFDEGNIFIN